MERLDEIEAYITPIWDDWFEEDQEKIHDHFQRHQGEIVYDLCDYVVQKVVPEICFLQSVGKQKEIAYFVIHFLRSSILNRSYHYEIKLYNDTLYLDENRVAGYWCPEFLYRFAADEEKMLKKEIQKKFIRVRAYEIELIRQKLFLQYRDIAKPYFEVLIHGLCETPEFKQIKMDDRSQFMYGEHMGGLEELKPRGDL